MTTMQAIRLPVLVWTLALLVLCLLLPLVGVVPYITLCAVVGFFEGVWIGDRLNERSRLELEKLLTR